MRFFTIQKLGPKRSLTPEGFLLCEDVPVARTGDMLYAEGEVPIEAGPDGLIRISRTPEEVFRDETMASCQGKDVTLDHPDDFVAPANYTTLTRGVMLNPRRGSGIEDDLLLADILIKDPAAITAVQDEEIEEVSLGYEADYEQVSPGRGVQRNIVVNHVAIVPRGRCGPRCAIGDKEPEMKTKDSKTSRRPAWLDRLMQSMKAKDEAGVEEALKEGQEAMDEESEEEREAREAKEKEGKTGDALAQILKTVKALDARMAKIEARDADPDDDDDDDDDDGKKKPTDDTIIEAETAGKLDQSEVDLYTGDSARLIAARAEILAPGVKLPTLDGLKTKDRAVALCKCQRRALDQAYETDAGRAAIAPFLGRRAPDFEALPAQVVDAIFTGAAELMRAKNNAGSSSGKVTTRDFGKARTVADINEANRKFWDRQGSAN
ncbi:DUF2213 domain-containing protein [Burkholderia vietnamiensis]|uniref:DUF2213 domain-containing protein n=1 Tax=Burkholderia vietnamiensis TaxID=60552 RepID=UPI00265180F1|nr:DUF2213 domain-containing protein [Burkholderia vietnamiensis]MDN7413578.1 DUF2213 domain-containing protein [Burkholderia vietnamiensis]